MMVISDAFSGGDGNGDGGYDIVMSMVMMVLLFKGLCTDVYLAAALLGVHDDV